MTDRNRDPRGRLLPGHTLSKGRRHRRHRQHLGRMRQDVKDPVVQELLRLSGFSRRQLRLVLDEAKTPPARREAATELLQTFEDGEAGEAASARILRKITGENWDYRIHRDPPKPSSTETPEDSHP